MKDNTSDKVRKWQISSVRKFSNVDIILVGKIIKDKIFKIITFDKTNKNILYISILGLQLNHAKNKKKNKIYPLLPDHQSGIESNHNKDE